MPTTKKAAVISADIVGSTALKPASRKRLQQVLNKFSNHATGTWKDLQLQQYRGDSLQAILTTNMASSLRVALLLQSQLLQEKFHIRTAIGIGSISFSSKNVVTSDGTAFHASGPYLDELKKTGNIISIAGNDPAFTNEWQAHSAALNYIIQRWTPQQAAAISLQLQEYTQQTIARKLKIKQPSVHQRLQAGGWHPVQKILQRFETVVSGL
ncbi:MAG: SatD family protein [Chitinophagaceae bacterium]